MTEGPAAAAKPPADGPESRSHIDVSAHRPDVSRLANSVDGGWRGVGGVEVLEDVEPASGEVAALVPLSGAAEVDAAVAAA
ncbi:MAG: hypothetical protein WA862_08590, partial [Solirubrobacterales bacterium]